MPNYTTLNEIKNLLFTREKGRALEMAEPGRSAKPLDAVTQGPEGSNPSSSSKTTEYRVDVPEPSQDLQSSVDLSGLSKILDATINETYLDPLWVEEIIKDAEIAIDIWLLTQGPNLALLRENRKPRRKDAGDG